MQSLIVGLEQDKEARKGLNCLAVIFQFAPPSQERRYPGLFWQAVSYSYSYPLDTVTVAYVKYFHAEVTTFLPFCARFR